jgi:hypothetical protein
MSIDLDLEGLRKRLITAGSIYSAAEVRKIVLTILLGKNYRRLTESATSLAISCYMNWILSVCHKARIAYGEEWLEKLQELCSATKRSQETKWLRVWLMGLALKTCQNLGIKVGEYPDYLKRVKLFSDTLSKEQAYATSIQLYANGLTPALLSTDDSVWLLQVAGAAVLTIRGSKKSAVGKLLEKAIAKACLKALGLKEGDNFQLNLAADNEVDREIDAEIETRRGKVRVDVALIGPGNQEVPEDKLSRVGRNGIVLVDKLGPKSKVPGNAAKHGVHLIMIQNHLPLSDLYNYLFNLMPEGVTLKKPPTEPKKIEQLLNKLPDEVFYVPTPIDSTII